MSTMNEILNDAKTLEKSYRAVLSLVAKVKEIGDLDKAYEVAELKLREHNQAVVTAENKMQAARDRLASVNDEVDRAKERAVEIIVKAENEATKMLDIASHDVAATNARLKKNVHDAGLEVEKFHQHVRDTNEKHKTRMDKNEAEFIDVTERLSVLNTELEALRKRIA